MAFEFIPNKDGIIEFPLSLTGAQFKYSKAINLKEFYMDLFNLLVQEDFTDTLGEGKNKKVGEFFDYQAKKGEHADPKNGNRTNQMFEIRFYYEKKNGFVEFEVWWLARKKGEYSPYGWVEFKLDLVVRRMLEKEDEKGNKLQEGDWEFRNAMTYKNNIVYKFLNTVPFVKNSPNLKQVYINFFLKKALRADVDFFNYKIIPKINALISKHFA